MDEHAFVANQDSAERLNAFGNEIVILAGSADTGNSFCLFHQVYGSQDWSPLHLHDKENHFVQIIRGSMQFEAAGLLHICLTGDGFYMPKGQWHRFRALGAEPVEMLIFNFPGGFDLMYREIATCPDGPAGELQRAAILNKYGVHVRSEQAE